MSISEGYVYAWDSGDVMARARQGLRIANKHRRPPYIIVAGSIHALEVMRWPGKLWRVRIVDPVTPADERAAGLAPLALAPGFARESSMSSFTLFAFTDGCTTSMNGRTRSMLIGAMPLTGSYGGL